MKEKHSSDFETTALAIVGMLVVFIVVLVSISFTIPEKCDSDSGEVELAYHSITMGGFQGLAEEEPEPCTLFFSGVGMHGTPDGGVYFNAYDWTCGTFCEVPVVNDGSTKTN